MKVMGENLKRIRKSKGISQDELAALVSEKTHGSFSRQSVSTWESGKVVPRVDNLNAVAEILGVTVDYLMGNDSAAVPNLNAVSIGDGRGKKRSQDFSDMLLYAPVLTEEDEEFIAAGKMPDVKIRGRFTVVGREELRLYDRERSPFTIISKGSHVESAGIFDGFLVIINPAETVANGYLGLVALNGLTSLKFIARRSNGDILLSCDEGTQIITQEEQANGGFHIIGPVVKWSPARRPKKFL